MFAAASNEGGRPARTIAYPASHHGHVFCINSADGDGVGSRFSPPPKHNGDNFSILGEMVEAACPEYLLDELHVQNEVSSQENLEEGNSEDESSQKGALKKVLKTRMSGTSMATPIAAGVAALVIEFMRQNPGLFTDDELANVESFSGMHQILRFMSSDSNKYGYSWIKPWEVFSEEREPWQVAALISYALSKRS
jgi:hypothetical protein